MAAQEKDVEGGVVDRDPTSELAVDFSETARILFAAGSVSDTLGKVLELAVTTIEAVSYTHLVSPATHGKMPFCIALRAVGPGL